MRPRVAITTGDPAGIGPEVAVRAAADPRVLEACEPVLYRPPAGETFAPGVLSAAAGRAAYDVVVRAVEDAQRDVVQAIATAPVNKEAFRLAGLEWSGHTDLLAHLTGSSHVAMMFHSDALRVVLATIHIPLAEVPRALTQASLDATIALTARELPRFGIARPRIAVAGLNPHAGEGGSLGHEDIDIVTPAIAELRAAGIDARGPLAADTMFHAAARQSYDAALCMYHDQALIPIKTLDFDGAVNVTLGLPFIRTSPDHGTAFDIAGQGIARPDSLIAALRLAAEMAARRRGG
jgi:4-hydroxythreonine-4-phosphate dehydrogenase